ncbi:MAG: hypothetical protein Q9N26_05420 [Aquificota bacterium]|nr:hypothetical protein [Aquificota bacterium]
MVWTGVYGGRTFSVEVSRFRKGWRPSSKTGRKIYVVPSNLCFVRFGKREIKDPKDLRRSVGLEVEERFGNALWDIRILGETYTLAVVKDFETPRDAYALDPEVFSLARSARALGFDSCTVVNLERDRTTLVRVREGKMSAYRVVLRGCDGERELLGEIIRDSGWDLSGEKVVLSGPLADPESFRGLFGDILKVKEPAPDLIPAFGSALRYVLPDEAPDFREEEVSPADLRKFVLVHGLAGALFLTSVFLNDFLADRAVGRLRDLQREVFRTKFPDLPPAGILDQLRAMAGEGGAGVTGLILKVSPSLREGIRLYRIEFNGVELKIVGEARSRDQVEGLKPKSVRRTPEGAYEFEVVVR